MNIVGSGTVNGKIYGSAVLGTLRPTSTGGIEIDLLNGGNSLTAFTGSEVATVQIVLRSDTAESWYVNNPILAAGEIGYNNEDKQLFVGDGVTAYQDFTNEHYIVHWDEFQSILSTYDSSISTLQSDLSTAQSDISALQTKTNGQDTFLSQLQQGLNDAVADISSLQSDISSEASTRSTAVTSLQGQIDAINTSLSDGLLKKFEVEISLDQIDGLAENNIEIITPSSGKYIMPLHSSAIADSLNLSSGQSAIRLKNQNDINTYKDLLIDDTSALNGLFMFDVNKDPSLLFTVDEKMILYFTLGNTWVGASGTLRLIIFYMEV
jgi:hypothetical protein